MPFDPEIEEMDPITNLYLYFHWIEDQNDKIEFFKNNSYLIGSFFNPEAVARLTQAQKTESSDEDFEKASQMILETPYQKSKAVLDEERLLRKAQDSKRKKKKRKLVE